MPFGGPNAAPNAGYLLLMNIEQPFVGWYGHRALLSRRQVYQGSLLFLMFFLAGVLIFLYALVVIIILLIVEQVDVVGQLSELERGLRKKRLEMDLVFLFIR